MSDESITTGGEVTPEQRQRNAAMVRVLERELPGFSLDSSLRESTLLTPRELMRLVHCIAECMPTRCDADDLLARATEFDCEGVLIKRGCRYVGGEPEHGWFIDWNSATYAHGAAVCEVASVLYATAREAASALDRWRKGS